MKICAYLAYRLDTVKRFEWDDLTTAADVYCQRYVNMHEDDVSFVLVREEGLDGVSIPPTRVWRVQCLLPGVYFTREVEVVSVDRTCSHCDHFESEVYHRGKILGSCRQNVYSIENSLCVWDSRPAVENYAVLPHKPCPHFVELSPTKRRFDMWMDRVEKTLTEHRMEEK